ncbi:MAG: dihydrolipoamide acetyltransferase family protein [Actinomycetota bacterium]
MADFLMPKLGADMTSGRLIAWRKKPGDTVQRGDIIADVETDKADIEVEVFTAGVIDQLLVEPGTRAPVGAILATIHTDGLPTAAPVARPARLRISPAARKLAGELGVDPATLTGTGPEGRVMLKDVHAAAARTKPEQTEARRLRASPAARKHAAALHLGLDQIHGSGPGGRITVEDVEVAGHPAPAVPAPPREEAADRRTRMREAIAATMERSQREIPHYYLATTIDLKAAMAWLAAENLKRPIESRLLIGALLMKAAALALREAPELNGFWIDGQATRGSGIHVGTAIFLRDGGLVAPAIHDTDQKSLDELMQSLRDLVARARSGGLRSSELTDGTITVTSLGDQGVETVFGVIYPPQVAIVGYGKVVERPWAVNGHLAAHPVVTVTLAADHRATDGHRGGRYLAAIDRLLQEPEKL